MGVIITLMGVIITLMGVSPRLLSRGTMEKLAVLFQECRENKEASRLHETAVASEQPDRKARASSRIERKILQASSEEETRVQGSPSTRNARRDGKSTAVEDDARLDRTVFVGNLPTSITKRKVRRLFAGFGKIETVRFRSAAVSHGKLPVHVARRLGRQLVGNTVNSYVVFNSSEEASKSLALNGHLVGERHIRVDWATPTKDTQRTVFVGNLPFTADEEQLRDAFQ